MSSQRMKYALVALLSVSFIGLELIWTRILSAEFYYTFSFLILSFAILGLSMGSLSLRLFKGLNNIKFLSVFIGLSALFSFVSPILLFKLQLDFSVLFSSFLMILKFFAAILLLSSSFYFGGLALSLLFKTAHKDMPKLYMADMVGAGISVILCIILMNIFGTQVATFLISIPLLTAAFLASGKKYIPLLALILWALFVGQADDLLESKRQERAPVIYEHWDAMAKIKIYEYAPNYRGMNIDNVANTPVIGFDGNIEDPMIDGWDIDVKNLIDRFGECTFLSLGSGGGADVMQALGYNAAEVYAVEVNPHMNKMMLKGDPKGYIIPDSIENKKDFPIVTCNDFTGNMYSNERVKVISEDARTYIRRFENKFDIIYSLSSNTWAALGSGSFAFAENYIFTTEAYIDYWHALSDNGFLSMEHQMYMPRIVSSAMDALKKMEIPDPEKHIAVYQIPQMRRHLILMSKQPLTDEIIQNAYGKLDNGTYSAKFVLYPLTDPDSSNFYSSIIENGWKSEFADAQINISPASDNKPFVAQLGRWKNFNFENLKKISIMSDFRGFPLTKVLLLVILLVILVIVVPLCILPYAISKEKLKAAPWFYFFFLGVAYISIEIVLMQKYTLYIGASFYSIATVLFSMLLASGIGSRFSERFKNRTVFISIILLVVFNILASSFLVHVASGLPIFLRSLLTAIMVFPLAFFMGMPFPKGTLKVGELIDWGFAVNGAASVLGSVLIMLIVFAWGFVPALLIAAAIYAGAFLLMEFGENW
jgi:hypothetical protein